MFYTCARLWWYGTVEGIDLIFYFFKHGIVVSFYAGSIVPCITMAIKAKS